MDKFVFLYPIKEFIDFELSNYLKNDIISEGQYYGTLNDCIDKRYRQKGFEVNFVTFKDRDVSEKIRMEGSDNTIRLSLTYKDHTEKKLYPTEEIANYLKDSHKLVLAGFHFWDCVTRTAEMACNYGIQTLVDEDLTEFFISRMQDPAFRTDTYPTYDPHKFALGFDTFMNPRRGKPYLWQKY